eukprot:Gregarina_sp_Pseudo_9__5465@NODE_692_length_2362_cov_6_974171_g654_i0_p1_GENE_NODE_692_length_2362_cov_6_974171_g654_i0NODE_692_length_2362_cov_6_974171_g654_i0_p1_ORF_typecomplete_len347_score79_25Arf/PF00025_21/2_3e33Gtr1_RagA/PF04670_12/1_9e12Ras/PF00071_22/5_5e10Roc/PF08477_13/7_1e10Galpha/PF00503_20/22Galpha/PF00503_20/1_7e07SRPRB/PF09439_10/9_7e09SRPRB/PF09439_10/5_7e03GTP_EFTU/PF00009_27/0_00086FeoB_N/PF02421_18/0_00055MMR_HSR1/PF01926_23/0_026_NODE_692_length_2362_cov_6_974171_g654_i0995
MFLILASDFAKHETLNIGTLAYFFSADASLRNAPFMFSLLSGLMQWLFTKPSMRFLVLGLDNAGKTTTLEIIKSSHGQRSLPLGSITPTVGLNIARVDTEGVSAFFWDLGGQVALRTLWSKYFEESHGILYICDIVDEERYQESINSLLNVMQHRTFKGRPIPVVVFLNKVDAIHPADRPDRFNCCRGMFTELNARLPSPLASRVYTAPKTTRIESEAVSVSLWHRGPQREEEPAEVAATDSPQHTPSRTTSEAARGPDPRITTIVAGSALSGAPVGRTLTHLLISECKKALADPLPVPAAPSFLVVDDDKETRVVSLERRALPLLREPVSPTLGHEWVQQRKDPV